eukprot:UN07608
MHTVYAHEFHDVWRLDELPSGIMPRTQDRGWPSFEEGVYTAACKNGMAPVLTIASFATALHTRTWRALCEVFATKPDD